MKEFALGIFIFCVLFMFAFSYWLSKKIRESQEIDKKLYDLEDKNTKEEFLKGIRA